MLTLANIAPEAQGLTESEPILGAEPALDDCAPQDEHIDPDSGDALPHFLPRERRFGRHGPHGWTDGTRPASSSVMILSVIS
jgi:hypothetical protein